MCLIALALDAHPRYSLVLAANRDEFHARPTAPASYWDDAPQIFGGRDLQQHGGWLAVGSAGRWAAVTNVRRMEATDPAAPSRGQLVAGYLRGTQDAQRYGEALAASASRYAGFNLLLGDRNGVWYLSNLPQFTMQRLEPGLHAVSNASLDTPWPKLVTLKSRLQQWCSDADTASDTLFAALADPRPAADADLPETGVGLDRERFLSSAFISSPAYGTRCSTVLTVDAGGHAAFHERRFGPQAAFVGETLEYLQLS
ncbi:NRDE family protein [Solimonas marina]|uniref:NRDE family protein n=1 Tax=Solimonas marina TaxID=2714601 RepID=A0A969W9D9_9GAMM|nr:NRDE family protein [Solimonas marina]NKF21964.1 NRDE family protein [Solimonas marina]